VKFRIKTAAGALLVVGVLGVLATSCSTGLERTVLLGRNPDGDAGLTPAFTPPELDGGETDAGNELTMYCPSDKCPAGRTTCSTSRFRCDVDLKNDQRNCGACGAACPAQNTHEFYECAEGRCLLYCREDWADCDGIPDNGCETSISTNDNCGACGATCTDPAKPCVRRSLGDYQCGCEVGKLKCVGGCQDVTGDDKNCGACRNVCPSTVDGGPAPYDYMYYGCVDSQCDRLKCVPYRANCDGVDSNGCEVDLLSSDNCGACGVVCPPGQACRPDQRGAPQCMCPAGTTFCMGMCVDLASDPANCGACGLACPSGPSGGSSAVAVCEFGICGRQCIVGTADCNGNEKDGCEVNTNNDPNNCGGCGVTCNAVAGQACVGGTCVVEPCPPGETPVEVPK